MARANSATMSDEALVDCCAPLTESPFSDREATVAANIFGALSDPVRLRMLSLIAAEDEVCSCALEAPLGKSQPTVSHHTKVLAEAGLIVGERRGHWMWWRVVPGQLNQVARLLTAGAGEHEEGRSKRTRSRTK